MRGDVSKDDGRTKSISVITNNVVQTRSALGYYIMNDVFILQKKNLLLQLLIAFGHLFVLFIFSFQYLSRLLNHFPYIIKFMFVYFREKAIKMRKDQ